MFTKSTFSKMLIVAVVLAIFFVSGPATAQTCPPQLAADPCAIDLVTGYVGPGCSVHPYLQFTSPPHDSNSDGWLEIAIEADLMGDCDRLCVVLDYTATPTGFTFNLGDSSTNNGYGGNSGPDSESEVQINDQRLTLWSSDTGLGALDEVATADLQLANGSYKVCVSNQHVTFGQPLSTASTPNSQLLFALPDNSTTPPNEKIYIGLNRVIHDLTGGPSLGRIGTGLSRAYITLD